MYSTPNSNFEFFLNCVKYSSFVKKHVSLKKYLIDCPSTLLKKYFNWLSLYTVRNVLADCMWLMTQLQSSRWRKVYSNKGKWSNFRHIASSVKCSNSAGMRGIERVFLWLPGFLPTAESDFVVTYEDKWNVIFKIFIKLGINMAITMKILWSFRVD